MNHQLAYWIFTSGEEGENGLDWGVKFSSPSLENRKTLDMRHRALLKEFGLPPGTALFEHGISLCLLPYEDSFVLSFIFPGTDHGGRSNTSAVVCVLPFQVIENLSVNQVVQSIWEKNDLAGIAMRKFEKRPDTLLMDSEIVTLAPSPVFSSKVNWPARSMGYLQIDGNLKIITRKEKIAESEKKAKKNFLLPLFIIAAVIAVIIVLKWPSDTSLNNVEQESLYVSNEKIIANEKQKNKLFSPNLNVSKVPAVKEKRNIKVRSDTTDIDKFKSNFISLVENKIDLVESRRVVICTLKSDFKQSSLDYILKFASTKDSLTYDEKYKEIRLRLPRQVESSALLEKCLDLFLSQFKKENKYNE